jgi:hypothetical protein
MSCLQLTNMLAAVGDLPRGRQKGGGTARRELDRVTRKALELAKDLLGLHSEALRAFESVEQNGNLHPLIMKGTLVQFAKACLLAYQVVPDTRSPKGRHFEVQKRQVAIMACKVYTELTGQRAGRSTDSYNGRPSGPLQAFVAQIFEVFGLEGSADAQLKALLYPSHGINALKR